jgi:hypothetical protein
MGYYCDGTIEIPLDEFTEFVLQYIPNGPAMTKLGVPKVNVSNGTIEIDFSQNTECWPEDEFDAEKKPVVRQWKELREFQKKYGVRLTAADKGVPSTE